MDTFSPALAWPPDAFVGGALCLDFANTVDDHDKRRDVDLLGDYAGLLAWAEAAGAVSADEAAALRAAATDRPEAAALAFRDALAVRERIHRVFAAVATGDAPAAGDLAALDAMWARAAQYQRLRWRDGRAVHGWQDAASNLDRPLGPVIRAAIELLTSPALARVKECGRCSWLFVDDSRGGRRRWCRMEACGNRAKAERHYARNRRTDA